MSLDTRARFITFEGGEGAGKSTQLQGLADRLANAGVTAVTTREPGGPTAAEAVRTLLLEPSRTWQPLSEALLHAAARSEHLAQTIRPALTAGHWVLCDRFMDSTRIYQGEGQGLAGDLIDALEAWVVGPTRPDLTLVLDIPPELGLSRAAGRGDRYQAMDATFHARVRDGFRRLAAAEPARCALIDAARSAAEVADEVRAVVGQRLGIAL